MIRIQNGGSAGYYVSGSELPSEERQALITAEHRIGRKADDPAGFHLHWDIGNACEDRRETIPAEISERRDCWFISCPWYDGLDGRILRQSRLMVMIRADRTIIFDSGVHPD